MQPWHCKDSYPNFQPYQIVCLEHAGTCLFAEVVQLVETRQVCWVRPLFLVLDAVPTGTGDSDSGQDDRVYLDLRQGSDLLLPSRLFRPAFDTEVLPLLTHLYEGEHFTPTPPPSIWQEQLHQFVGQVWQAYPELFQER